MLWMMFTDLTEPLHQMEKQHLSFSPTLKPLFVRTFHDIAAILGHREGEVDFLCMEQRTEICPFSRTSTNFEKLSVLLKALPVLQVLTTTKMILVAWYTALQTHTFLLALGSIASPLAKISNSCFSAKNFAHFKELNLKPKLLNLLEMAFLFFF